MKNLKKKGFTNSKGFTIVELVIVIAVIAILSAVLIPTFSNLIRKANVSADTQLVKQLNQALAVEEVENGKNATMHDALETVKEYGFDIAKINAKANLNEILWDSKNNIFVYYNDETKKIEYIPNSEPDDKAEDYELWKVYDVLPSLENQSYSIYYIGEKVESVEVKVGLDTSSCLINEISYVNDNKDQVVIINTNGGNLSVENGSVVHYGFARYLTLNDVASYVERGNIVADITDYEQETDTTGWTVVSSADELTSALEQKVEKILLGDNITITNDITVSAPNMFSSFVVTSNVEINLNGYNIAGTHKNNNDTLNLNNVLISVQNNASLTLSGYGVVSLKYEGTEMKWNALSSTLRINGGTGSININDAVVVEHLGGTSMSYAIDVYATNSTMQSINLNGGALCSTYIAIRSFFQNNENFEININAGIIDGQSRDIWYQGFENISIENVLKVADTYKVTFDGSSYYID